MTLADNIHLGDKLQVAPSWQHGEHNATPAAKTATVIYVHPQGRYCTVRYQDGITDTVQMAPADKVVSEQPVGPEKLRHHRKMSKNIWVRQAMSELHVTQNAVAAAMGISKSTISNLLGSELSYDQQEEIILAAERVAEARK